MMLDGENQHSLREIKERPAGPIREGKFGARALSLDDSPPAIHSYGISIQTPCGLRILEQRNQNSSTSVEIRESPVSSARAHASRPRV